MSIQYISHDTNVRDMTRCNRTPETVEITEEFVDHGYSVWAICDVAFYIVTRFIMM
jgi:hypothetical protein